MKGLLSGLAAGFALLMAAGVSSALDSPHDVTSCNDCHTLHKAPGGALTLEAENPNLCMSCHRPLGTAAGKPFSDPMQATPGGSGTSHRWDAIMPVVSDPDNPHGLRAVVDLANAELRTRVNGYGGAIVCSVCHDPHDQGQPPWDPFASGVAGESGNHLLQFSNALNELCEDCHYYRVDPVQTDVRTWDGKKKSHPVAKVFSSANGETPSAGLDTTQFNTAPLEPGGASYVPQTGARYHLNGGGDTNLFNNIVLDQNGEVRCLSCHGFHYTDSDASTEDIP